jgi:hypothetical protein
MHKRVRNVTKSAKRGGFHNESSIQGTKCAKGYETLRSQPRGVDSTESSIQSTKCTKGYETLRSQPRGADSTTSLASIQSTECTKGCERARQNTKPAKRGGFAVVEMKKQRVIAQCKVGHERGHQLQEHRRLPQPASQNSNSPS